MCKMSHYKRFIFFMSSENLLPIRNCLLNLHQNASKNALKLIEEAFLPPKPKRPVSPFILYVKQIHHHFTEEEPNIKYSDVLKKASKRWAVLNPIEKEHFQKQYSEKYEAYTKKLQEYNNSITKEQKQLWEEKKKEYEQTSIGINNKRMHEIFGKPKKPSNAYLSYVMSKKSEKDPNISFKNWMKCMAIRWKELSNEEKEPYVDQAIHLLAQYKIDLEKWEMEMIRSGHPDIVRAKTLMKYNLARGEQ
ncbi:PREDICTED: high mobility group B protein 6 [Eufriesea mexicana]|uniref:high mobility group B protein 6 n=1 Tax=Eufriesea mexicana TaxID=516756 RepID=UPI00083BF9BC|nr:PREDICTED: high mobility group B protein 6 [Eufriesea mexicana]